MSHRKNTGHGWRIIRTKKVNGREYYLHSTKGWRSRRA
jgi:hypothetical protein